MVAKEIEKLLVELRSLGCTVVMCGPRAHCYAKVLCDGGCCAPIPIYGTPRVPEHERQRVLKKISRCPTITEGEA
ncbi:hypothetical protein GCM10022221_05080 [Actinocorallia aurea]